MKHLSVCGEACTQKDWIRGNRAPQDSEVDTRPTKQGHLSVLATLALTYRGGQLLSPRQLSSVAFYSIPAEISLVKES